MNQRLVTLGSWCQNQRETRGQIDTREHWEMGTKSARDCPGPGKSGNEEAQVWAPGHIAMAHLENGNKSHMGCPTALREPSIAGVVQGLRKWDTLSIRPRIVWRHHLKGLILEEKFRTTYRRRRHRWYHFLSRTGHADSKACGSDFGHQPVRLRRRLTARSPPACSKCLKIGRSQGLKH